MRKNKLPTPKEKDSPLKRAALENSQAAIDAGLTFDPIKIMEAGPEAAPSSFKGISSAYPSLSGDYYDKFESYIDANTLKGRQFSLDDLTSLRAQNQSNWEQAGNAIARVATNIIPQTISGFASMLDIPGYFSAEEAANNSIVNWAIDAKKEVDEDWFPIYEEAPGQSMQLGDFAWWMSRGSGLVESVGSFVLQGAGMGKLVSLGLKGVGTLTRGKQLATAVLGAEGSQRAYLGSAGLLNAVALNQSEAVLEATQVFRDTYQEQLEKNGGNIKNAKEAASIAAATTMSINRANILLNLSSASAFITPLKASRQLLKAPTGVKGTLGRIGIEAGQEGVEELVNLVASKAGMAKGKGEEYSFEKALEDIKTMEGLEAVFLGAIGGAGQTGLTSGLKYSKFGPGSMKDEQGNRISNVQYERNRYEQQQEVLEELKQKGVKTTDVLQDFKDQLIYQEKLKAANEKGDVAEMERLKEQLFENQAVKAFRSGTTEVLENLYNAEAARPVEEVGEEYIARAKQAVKSLKELEGIYNNFEGYQNTEEIFFNRANKLRAEKTASFIESQKKETDFQYSKDLQELAKQFTFENEREVLFKEEGKVVRTEKKKQESPLIYSTADIENNTGDTEQNKKTYEKFLAEVKKLPSYEAAKGYGEQMETIQNVLRNNTKEFQELTSKDYQEKVKVQKQEAQALEKARQDLKTAKDISSVERLKNNITNKEFQKEADAKIEEIKLKNDKTAKEKELAVVLSDYDKRIKNTTEEADFDKLREEINTAKLSEADRNTLLNKVNIQAAKVSGEDVSTEEEAESNPLEAFSQGEEEVKKEVKSETKSFETTLPTDLPNPSTEKSSVEEGVAQSAKELIKSDTTTVSGQDENGNLIYNFNRSEEGHNRGAFLSREFNQKEEVGVISREEINNSLDNLNLLDPDFLTQGTELEMEIDTDYAGQKYNPESNTRETIDWKIREAALRAEATKKGIPVEQLDEYIAEVPIKVSTTDGQQVFYVHDNSWYTSENLSASEEDIAIDKAKNFAIRKAIVSKGKVKSEVTYKSFGKLFKTFDGKSLSVSEAMPDSNLVLGIGKNGGFSLAGDTNDLLGKSATILGKDSQPGRLYAIVKVGPNEYLPIPLQRTKLAEAHAKAIVLAVEGYLSQDKNNPIVKAIAESSLGVDITDLTGLRKYIGQFIYLFPTVKNEGLESVLIRGGQEGSKLKSDMGLFAVTATGIEFGRPSVPMGSYKNKQGETITQIAGTISANFNKTTDGKLRNAQMLIKLEQLLKKAMSNADLTQLAENGSAVIILNKEGETSSVKYTEFLKQTHETNILSVNTGTEESPKWAYTIQPTILFDTSFADFSNITPATVVQKQPSVASVSPGAKPVTSSSSTTSVSKMDAAKKEIATKEQQQTVTLGGKEYTYSPLATGTKNRTFLMHSAESILLTDEFGNAAEVEISKKQINSEDIIPGAIFYTTADAGVSRIVTIEESLPDPMNPSLPKTYSIRISSWSAGGSQAFKETGIDWMEGSVALEVGISGAENLSKQALATELNRLGVKKLSLKKGIVLPVMPSLTNQGKFSEDTTIDLPVEFSLSADIKFTSQTVFNTTFNNIGAAVIAAKLAYISDYTDSKGKLTEEGKKMLKQISAATTKANLSSLNDVIERRLSSATWKNAVQGIVESITLEAYSQNKELTAKLLSSGKVNFEIKKSDFLFKDSENLYLNALKATRETFRVQNLENLNQKLGFTIPTANNLLASAATAVPSLTLEQATTQSEIEAKQAEFDSIQLETIKKSEELEAQGLSQEQIVSNPEFLTLRNAMDKARAELDAAIAGAQPIIAPVAEDIEAKIADIEKRRKESIVSFIKSRPRVKLSSNEEIVKAREELNKQTTEINDQYDAEYLEAVKKGEIPKDRAMRAISSADGLNRKAYAELAALEESTTTTVEEEVAAAAQPVDTITSYAEQLLFAGITLEQLNSILDLFNGKQIALEALKKAGFETYEEAEASYKKAAELLTEALKTAKTFTLPGGKKIVIHKYTKDSKELGEDISDVDDMIAPLEEGEISEIREEIDELIIRGLDPSTQMSVIYFIAGDIIKQTLEAKNKEGKQTIKTGPIFAKHKEAFEKLAGFYEEMQLPNKAKRVRAIVEQFSKVNSLTNQYMSKLTVGTVNENVDMTDAEEALGLEKIVYSDDWAFTISSKNTASADLKKFFTSIQERDENGNPIDNILGLPEMMPFDVVYDTLHEILANRPADYDHMIQVMELYSERFTWMQSVIEQLEDAPEKIQNEFVSDMAKHSIDMQFIMWSKDRNGNYSLQRWSSNASAIEQRLRLIWNSNLKGAGTKSNLIAVNDEAEYVFDQTTVDSLLAAAEEFKKNPSKVTNDELASWLGQFGIVITDTTYEDLRKGRYSNRGKKSWNGLFKDDAGIVAVLAKELKAKRDLTLENAELLNDSAVKALAKLDAANSVNTFSNSFRAGEKTIYSYGNNNYLVNRMRDLTAYDNETGEFVNQTLIKELQSISFSKDSLWLNDLTNEDRIGELTRSTLNLSYLSLEALKKKFTLSQDNRKLNNLTAAEHEVVKLGFFQNQSGEVLKTERRRLVHFFYPTMSDKTTMLAVKAVARQFKLVDGEVSKENFNLLYDAIVVPEINRMRDKQATDIAGYEPNYFYFLPSLNTLEITLDEDTKTFREIVLDKDEKLYDPRVKEAVIEKIEETFNNLITKKLEDWKKLGIGQTIKDDRGNIVEAFPFMDKTYMKEVAKTGKGIDKVSFAAMDYVFNYMIANAEAFKLFAGDPALYAKFKKDKSLQENLEETFVNIGKRLAGDIAPGIELANSTNNRYYQVFLQDQKIDSNNTKDSVQKEFFDKIIKDYSKNYSGIEGSDAQEYTTWQEHLYVLKQLGRLTDAQYKAFTTKLESQSKGVINSSTKLTFEELGLVMQPIKPVYVGNSASVADNVDRRVYIKSSSFPLLPELTAGLQIDKIRQALETFETSVSKEAYGGSSPFVRASFGTANKVGAIKNTVKVFNPDGTVVDNLSITPDNTLLLSRANFRIQQDVPYKRDKSEVNRGTQETKLLFADLLDVEIEDGLTGAQLMESYNNNYEELFQYAQENLAKKLGLIKTVTKETRFEELLFIPESEIFNKAETVNEAMGKASPINKIKLQEEFAEEIGEDTLERVNFINKNFNEIVNQLAKAKMNFFFDEESNTNKKC
jgi:hypothetical protein